MKDANRPSNHRLRDEAERWLLELGFDVDRCGSGSLWKLTKRLDDGKIETYGTAIRVASGQPHLRGKDTAFHLLWFETEPPQSDHHWLVAWYRHDPSSGREEIQLTLGTRSNLDWPTDMPFPYRTVAEKRALDEMQRSDYIDRKSISI